MLIAGIEQYNLNIIGEIAVNKQIDGVVLGDLFCDKRMFDGGSFFMLDCMRRLKEADKKVFFQTPKYVTDRNFENIIVLIKYMVENNLIDAVLVQDIGVIRAIGREFPNLQQIWSRMGRSRNPAANLLFFEYLRSIGVNAVENNSAERLSALAENGFSVYSVFGNLMYNTLNRECYYKYQNNIFDSDCKKGCLHRGQRMVSGDHMLDMTVDGYLLGKNYQYNTAVEFKSATLKYQCPVVVYAENYKLLLEMIQLWECGACNGQ